MNTPLLRGLALASVAALAVACHEVHFQAHSSAGEIDLYDDLFAVSLPSADKAVAVGYRGAIYTSDDGGGSWAKRDTGSEILLYDVSMVDDNVGWSVGQLGTVLRTDDGGASWVRQTNSKAEDGYHLFAIQALDARQALAVGEWGTRLYTGDGGETWQDRSLTIDTTHPQYVWLSPPEQERVRRGDKVFEDVSLNDLYCRPAPSTLCWLVGEFGYIFWSDDHGKNWNRAEIVGTESVDPVFFNFDESEISDEDAARIQSFVEVILPQQHLNVLVEAFGNRREIRRFGGSDDPSGLFDILDSRAVGVRSVIEETGILSDRIRMRGTPPWDYEDFQEDDPGFLGRYLDGRLAARPQVTVRIAQNPYLFRIRFSDDQNGIIAGLGGVVLTSDDGGRTWRYGESNTKQAIYAVAENAITTLAVGDKGLARVSNDRGRTWNRAPEGMFPELFTFMRDLSFGPDGSLGMIVGQRGLVLRSRDRGASWEKVLPPTKVTSVSPEA